MDVVLFWRSIDVAAMEDSGCSVAWCWTMRVVFFRPFLRRALQGTPPLTTQQMCVYPSSVTPDASVSFLTVPHARLHVEGVEMSKGRGVSCQFKIPTSPIKSQNKIQRVQSDIKDSPLLPRHVHNHHHLARDAQLFADVLGDGGGGADQSDSRTIYRTDSDSQKHSNNSVHYELVLDLSVHESDRHTTTRQLIRR